MRTLSVSVPEDLKKKMLQLDEINWSAIARKAFEEKIDEVKFLKNLASKSKLTEEDARELSEKINRSMAKKFREM